MDQLRLAFSPCPNDTHIFNAWVQGLIPDVPPVKVRLEDVDTLNLMARRGEADVVKVSFYTFAHVQADYALLHSGGALGRGCGPLVVTQRDSGLRPVSSVDTMSTLVDRLERARVAIPGDLTTAAFLLGLFLGGSGRPVVMPFERIMPAVISGEVDAGVIIHEGRFTYGALGLRRLLDLGEWWEETTGLPVPLGGIAVSRSLERPLQQRMDAAMRASVEYARLHPEASVEYVRSHAQEMDEAVCEAHIGLYVNDFTLDYGSEGEVAIRRLIGSAVAAGLVPPSQSGIFWDD